MASIEDIIKILNSKTTLHSMGDGSASAIPKRNFKDVAMEINKLFYEPQPEMDKISFEAGFKEARKW